MEHPALRQILSRCAQMPDREDTRQYLSGNLGKFIRPGHKVLLCLPQGQGSVGELMHQAVLGCNAVPVPMGEDLRWKALLRLAFSVKATTIIAPPLIVLGLTKLSKATGIPLFIENVLTLGYPCLDWMIDGIAQGLDCNPWGCYTPGNGEAVVGFSCGKSRGIHIRDDVFGIETVDERGTPVPMGAQGRVVVYRQDLPELRYPTEEWARLDESPCLCGCPSPRLMDMTWGGDVEPALMSVSHLLHSWTSVLDCQVIRGDFGLEIEMVVFPGKKLPQLPSCAKLVIRNWDPETDAPMRWF